MLAALLQFITSLCQIAPTLNKAFKEKAHEEKVVELLECYYILSDLVDTSDQLLSLVQDKKYITFSELPTEELDKNYQLVQTLLTIQLQRLQRIGEIFIDEPTIELLDQSISKDFKIALGQKGSGLYSIGAQLFMNKIFGSAKEKNEPDEQAKVRIVKEQYEFATELTEANTLSIEQQRELLSELRKLKERYREIMDDFTAPNEKTLLSKKAIKLSKQYGIRK